MGTEQLLGIMASANPTQLLLYSANPVTGRVVPRDGQVTLADTKRLDPCSYLAKHSKRLARVFVLLGSQTICHQQQLVKFKPGGDVNGR